MIYLKVVTRCCQSFIMNMTKQTSSFVTEKDIYNFALVGNDKMRESNEGG